MEKEEEDRSRSKRGIDRGVCTLTHIELPRNPIGALPRHGADLSAIQLTLDSCHFIVIGPVPA